LLSRLCVGVQARDCATNKTKKVMLGLGVVIHIDTNEVIPATHLHQNHNRPGMPMRHADPF
jgi:hypothetical protein